MEYLSDGWFEAANLALADLELESGSLVIEQRLTGAEPAVTYQLIIGSGRAHLSRVGDRGADIVLTQSKSTVHAVRSGSLSALEAMQNGRISIQGDPQRLIEWSAALAAIDGLLRELDTGELDI